MHSNKLYFLDRRNIQELGESKGGETGQCPALVQWHRQPGQLNLLMKYIINYIQDS